MTDTTDLQIVETHDREISVRLAELELANYVYRPDHPQLESPKPYFHPMRDLRGEVVSCYRPWDHIWHKGAQLALPHVGDTNFWGGPTYVRDRGYQQLANNGSQDHERFTTVARSGSAVEVTHELSWHTEQGERWLSEQRSWQLRLLPRFDAWVLGFTTSLHNVRGEALAFGSPTTNGRPAAGYGGFFWRGPRSFTGGKVFTDKHDDAESAMGESANWLAYVGVHDETLNSSTVLFVDDPGNPRHPTPWFVRSEPYAAVCPAPFFATELELPVDATLTLRYDFVVATGAWDQDQVTSCVEAVRAAA